MAFNKTANLFFPFPFVSPHTLHKHATFKSQRPDKTGKVHGQSSKG